MAWGNALLVVLLSALPQIAAGNGCTATQIQNDLLPNHATPSSCWTVIVVNRQKVVYDVTKLVSNHEGGRRVIEQMCGRDGSIGFWCWHTLEDLQESIDDGDATEICRTSASVRRLDAREDASGRRLDEWDESDEDDDEGIRNSCAAGGSLPPAPATQILASEVANHKSSGDCWTSMTQGTTNVVMDITNYMTLHPGGKAYILSMCGRDSTAAFQVYHPWTYVTEAVRHGYVLMKGQLSGTYPVITTTTVTLAPGVTTTTGPTSSPQTKITATVLGQHASTSSCWGRIGSWVVDMTQLLSTHPAGNSMLTCGQDVTASFRSIHADSYISRMPVMGTWDDTVIRRPTPTPSPSPATTTAPTPAAPAPSPPQIVGGQTSILNPQVPSESNEMISSTDVAGHSTKADCWLALRCKVYDMTAYVPLHTADKYASAGNGAIERLCGSDATAAFEAVHPISYIDVSVSLGAIYQGLLAGCGAPPATASTTQPPTTTAAATTAPPSPAPSPEMVPVNATLWYELRFPNLVAATQNLGSVQTETSLSVAVANTMAQQGLSNVRCIVSNLRSGSILATVGLFMKDVGQLEHVQFFGRNHMTKVSWLGDSPTVQGTPTLDVAYATSPTPTQASTATTSSLPVYTIDQVRDHNSNVDCWMAIHGKVYSFMGAGGAHPAGNFLSLGICGVEASATFDLHHPLSYLSVSALKKIGGAQVGTLSSASAEDAGRTYPRPSPVQVLPNIVVTLNSGSTDFLQKHNLGQDCWMALHGDVYDATSMLSQHDGGRANVEALCGLDATASFDCVHGMGEIQEAVNDYGISKVGTTTTVLGQGCTFQLQAGMLPDQQITWEELAKHSTTQDCWVILGSQGIVWDITAYLPKHTGGSASVGMHCGGDATSPFDKKHKAGYITTMAQKGGIPQGTISGPQPALDSGTVHLTPLQMSEVAKHSIAADCWVAVHGYVLDVTGYLDRHSGGRQSIVSLCGQDGTASFDGVSHPTSYITMMAQKRLATIKGCVGSCTTNGAPVSTGSGIGTSPELTGPKAQVPARECRANEPQPPAVTVTNAELQTHSTATDCWMVLGCGVYDISNYKHSGGNIVHSWCGKDGTTSFTGKHPWSYLQIMIGMNAQLVGKYGGTPVGSSVGRQNPISLAEIAQHNTPSDCWSCIHGTVYELHFYLPDHDAGSAVIEPMCGEDATAYFAMAHSMDALGGLPTKGSCDSRAEQAFTEQNILDGAALVAYIIFPMFLNEVIMAATSPATQDRLLRRPMAKPFKSQCLGNLLNSYVEMPLGVFIMLVWFLVVTAVLSVLWSIHYNAYYLPDFVLAGWVGRMTVYMISMATYLGTRRWSLAWVFYKISYEKTLKAHYVVGTVASIFMLLHGITYMASFGPENLPEHQVTTAYLLLGCILIVFPFTINNFRVHCYSVFKLTHFIAPAITIIATFHILSLNVDGVLGRGFWVALVWIASASLFWIGDFIYSRYDVLLKPTVVIGTPRLLPADGGPAHISVKLRKLRSTLFPGAWMSVACREAFSPLSHPFTAIVRKCGGLDREYAEVEFIFKVNEGRTWTQRLSNAVAKLSPKEPMKFYMTGPYGGGLGSLDPMKVIIFVVGGVGVTPAASIAPYLIKGGKDVYVIWSCRSASLIQHVAVEYFSNACGSYFDRLPDHRNIHFSGKASDTHVFPPFIKTGRPDIPGIMQKAVKSAMSQDIFDIGVFVCGPNALVESTLVAADQLNADKTNAHVHVHAESFQM